MLKYLEPGKNPWKTENEASEEAKNDGYLIVGANLVCPIHCALAKRKQKGLEAELDFRFNNFSDTSLKESIIQEMIDNKIISEDRKILK